MYETSTVEIEKTEKIRAYPNPTKGQLTIESGGLKIKDIEIYDVIGKVQIPTLKGDRRMSIIDISHLPAGIYFLKIQTENNQIKIIKIIISK
jgi:hypothetical protein